MGRGDFIKSRKLRQNGNTRIVEEKKQRGGSASIVLMFLEEVETMEMCCYKVRKQEEWERRWGEKDTG